MQETTKGTSGHTSAGASGSLKSAALKPWEIAAKLLPSASGQVDIEHASDSEFQAWVDASGLADLIDDDGIAAWSFDDRIRLINFALRQGRNVPFLEPLNNSNNSGNNSPEELFRGNEAASEAV